MFTVYSFESKNEFSLTPLLPQSIESVAPYNHTSKGRIIMAVLLFIR